MVVAGTDTATETFPPTTGAELAFSNTYAQTVSPRTRPRYTVVLGLCRGVRFVLTARWLSGLHCCRVGWRTSIILWSRCCCCRWRRRLPLKGLPLEPLQGSVMICNKVNRGVMCPEPEWMIWLTFFRPPFWNTFVNIISSISLLFELEGLI